MITLDEEVAIEVFTKMSEEHGLERALKIGLVVKTMTDAVEEKYGQCDEILPAIEVLSAMLKRAKERTNA